MLLILVGVIILYFVLKKCFKLKGFDLFHSVHIGFYIILVFYLILKGCQL